MPFQEVPSIWKWLVSLVQVPPQEMSKNVRFIRKITILRMLCRNRTKISQIVKALPQPAPIGRGRCHFLFLHPRPREEWTQLAAFVSAANSFWSILMADFGSGDRMSKLESHPHFSRRSVMLGAGGAGLCAAASSALNLIAGPAKASNYRGV